MADRRPLDHPEAPHSAHDLLLVAAHAAGDLEAGDLARADALIAACPECATLAADLRAIARASAELPAPRRPRDFFLQPADAARLRPNRLRRLAAAIAGPRIPVARPLAGGLMMLGFAGLLVAALPGVSQQGTPAAGDQRVELMASPTPGSDIQGQPGAAPGASREPSPTDPYFVDTHGGGGQGASPAPAAQGPFSTPAVGPDSVKTSRDTAAAGPSPLVIGSLALVAIGAVLFAGSLLRPGPRRS